MSIDPRLTLTFVNPLQISGELGITASNGASHRGIELTGVSPTWLVTLRPLTTGKTTGEDFLHQTEIVASGDSLMRDIVRIGNTAYPSEIHPSQFVKYDAVS